MRNEKRLLFAAVLIAGCGGSGATTTMMQPMRPAGFNPPPIAPGEVEYDSPIIKGIAPGTDVTYCSYLDTRVADATDVVHFRVTQSLTGHHAILFAAKQARPVDTHVCTEDDMINTRFVAAGGAESVGTLAIPDGLAFRIPAGTQLMMQTHWINATMNTVDGQAVAYITTQPASPSRQVLDLFNVVLTDFTIPAGKTLTASTTCTAMQDLQLYTITGHEHEFGQHVGIQLVDGTNTSMLWDYDWQPQFQSAPPYRIFGADQPFLLKAGQQIHVTCTWNNPGTNDIGFPREMCVSSSFYFPAVNGEIDCVDGHWGG